jgi:SH3-like domain-containing protein
MSLMLGLVLAGMIAAPQATAEMRPEPRPETVAPAPVAPSPQTGPVTNLPLPRFVSMKAAEGNVRRGPSLTHRIDWVFRHRDMPLQIVGEYGHWRRVIDREGAGGWMHYALLSGVRTVIVEQDLTPIRAKPLPDAPIRARAEAGVIARLEGCRSGWCRLRTDAARGWVEETALWGLDDDLGLSATRTAAR